MYLAISKVHHGNKLTLLLLFLAKVLLRTESPVIIDSL